TPRRTVGPLGPTPSWWLLVNWSGWGLTDPPTGVTDVARHQRVTDVPRPDSAVGGPEADELGFRAVWLGRVAWLRGCVVEVGVGRWVASNGGGRGYTCSIRGGSVTRVTDSLHQPPAPGRGPR